GAGSTTAPITPGVAGTRPGWTWPSTAPSRTTPGRAATGPRWAAGCRASPATPSTADTRGREAAAAASRSLSCRLSPMAYAVLIVNPHASEVTKPRLAAVEAVLRRVAELDVRQTERRAHATELARDAEDEADAILVYGGDGAFNEVVNGLSRDVPVGFLPGGRTNVLPRALGLPRQAERAAERLAEALERGRTRRISLGRVNGRRFAFSAGVGLDAELVRRVDALGRSDDGKRPGDLAYVRTTVALLRER